MKLIFKATNGLKTMALALALFLSGCIYYGDPSVYTTQSEYYPYHYNYYPSAQVYFHLGSGLYYYRSGSRWLHNRVLPSDIYLNSRDRRRVWSRDEPYRYYSDHQRRFPPSSDYRRDRTRDRNERANNNRRYKEYRGRR